MGRAKLSIKNGSLALPGLLRALDLLPSAGTPIRQKDLKEAAKKAGIAWTTVKRQLEVARGLILVLPDKDVDERGQPQVTYRLATPDLLPIDSDDRSALLDAERLRALVGSARPDVARPLLEAYIVNEMMVLRLFGLRVLMASTKAKSDAEARELSEVMLRFFLERHFLNIVQTLRALPKGALETVDSAALELLSADLGALEAGVECAIEGVALVKGPEAEQQRRQLEANAEAARSLRAAFLRPRVLRGIAGDPVDGGQDAKR